MIRTHHWDDWSLDDLLAAKGATARSASSCRPATRRRPSATSSPGCARRSSTPSALLDEIVVIDSDSTDDDVRRRDRRRRGRAPLGGDPPRPRHPPGQGRGDVEVAVRDPRRRSIVFMDADLLDWDTHFVPGLLGPLLTGPEVAAGQGLLRAADGQRRDSAVPFEGGRVTELVARPLIRAALPRARRAAPAAGRGVGGPAVALRDARRCRPGTPSSWPRSSTPSRAHGLDALAQVDLGTRAHRHQSLRDLSGMAAQILAAALARAGAAGCLDRQHGAATSGRRRCRSHDAAARPPRVRRRRHADDGDRQPHARLLLRQGRDLGGGQGLRPGRARSSTQGAEIVDIGGIKAAPGVEIDAAEEKPPGRSTSSAGCARRTPAW